MPTADDIARALAARNAKGAAAGGHSSGSTFSTKKKGRKKRTPVAMRRDILSPEQAPANAPPLRGKQASDPAGTLGARVQAALRSKKKKGKLTRAGAAGFVQRGDVTQQFVDMLFNEP